VNVDHPSAARFTRTPANGFFRSLAAVGAADFGVCPHAGEDRVGVTAAANSLAQRDD